ncbi:MAG: glucarate dehydratase [Chloroflexota bacterium]|nr:glucarate dehydratase [Chloroflexota bacterium]MDE2910258.1 glucarate dehydratase [Chloroflexota bacterium]
MRISEIHITPVAVPDPPLLNAAGLHAPYALRIIIELVSADGLSGWGEIPGSDAALSALKQAAKHLIGMDPWGLNAIDAKLESLAKPDERGATPWDQRTGVHVRSAIEVACFDLLGKSIGRPAVDLLGGAVRERVPFSAYLFYKYEGAGGDFGFGRDASATGWFAARADAALDPAGVVAQARAMIENYGFKSIKLKGGAFEPQQEVDAILALRDAFGPDMPLRLDPNAIWRVDTAIAAGKQLEGLLEYYEDPVRGQANMGAVSRALDIPLATNMCTTSFADLPGSIAHQSEAIILSDHHFWGGFRATLELARFCAVFGRGLSMHSNSHLGISVAAMTHLAAAVPELTYDCDTHYPWQDGYDLLAEPLPFEDGAIAVPRGSGLGIEVDRAKLAQLHQQYLACGLTERDDEAEMQKVQPGWTFQATRW